VIDKAGKLKIAGLRMRSSASMAAMSLTLIMALLPIQAQAQSSGLKLGTETPQNNTPKLDLGAAPKAQAPAAQPSSPARQSTGARSTGTPGTYGAWEVACQSNDCAMAQIGKDNEGTPILEMVVRSLPEPLESDGRTAVAVIDFITPLGVVLISGLEISIDGGQGEGAPFQICTEQGCLVREPVDDGLITRLKRGNNAKISIVAANQGEVNATISLSGFTKAYNSL